MKKKLDEIKIQSDSHFIGNEEFTFDGKSTDMTLLDFWRWHYSEIYVLQDVIAEFIVAKALGFKEAHNVESWTLYDIDYRNIRVEVKETSYYHAWLGDEIAKETSKRFDIHKAFTEYKDNTSELKRQNDIYVFCLNTGLTKDESNPLELKNWEFYILPTDVINEKFGNVQSISLSRIRELTDKVEYSQIKNVIDEIIDKRDK